MFLLENYFRINTIYLKDEKKENKFLENLTWVGTLFGMKPIKVSSKNQIINAKYYIMGPISFGTEN